MGNCPIEFKYSRLLKFSDVGYPPNFLDSCTHLDENEGPQYEHLKLQTLENAT